jgi:hypothetical protein
VTIATTKPFDAAAVSKALTAHLPAARSAEADPEEISEPAEDRFPRINWKEAFATDFTDIDWLAGKFCERGQQISIVGDGKVGKTLFVHNWLYCAITGRSFLGDVRRDPIKVLYFDKENSLRDIVTRMTAFGARHEELGHLDYRMFPRFNGSLDNSDAAAYELLSIVDETEPDVVVLDTVSRFIAGKENDSDTWLELYRRLHVPLKQRRVAAVRLDHMGKDSDRGSRGSSAKTQDVDAVWELGRTDERTNTHDDFVELVTQLRFKRTHTRNGLGDDTIDMIRRGMREKGGMWLAGGTRHELCDPGDSRRYAQEIQSYVDELATKGAPRGAGRESLRKWAESNGVKVPQNHQKLSEVAAALKIHYGNDRSPD